MENVKNIIELVLKFEGKYLNGKKNGEGKEYKDNDNTLIFEGVFFNGKKLNGKQYSNGKLEGEYLNGDYYKKV